MSWVMRQIITAMAVTLALTGGEAEATDLDIRILQGTDVVFLGEVHDNPEHHDTQVQAVLSIAPKALVFEMLTPLQAAVVAPDLLDNAEALEEALGWAESGWPDFSMYYPLFAVSEGMRIYGAQIPREVIRRSLGEGGIETALDGEAAQYGLTAPLPEAQQSVREALQMDAHCGALPAEMLPVMVMAQRLRDARLAQAASEALAETGGPVVVITGNGHARNDWGAPTLLDPQISVVTFGQLEADPTETPPYDAWVVTAPAPRDDPCAVFQ